MINKVCIDTHIAVWGIKNQAEPDQIEMIKKARGFFDDLDQKNIQVIIPTVVVAELLVQESFEKQVVFLDVIQKNFIVGILDLQVAMEYARIVGKRHATIDKIMESFSVRKDKMKFDHIIVATALLYGASCIYSYDDGVKKFAEGLIEVKEMPDLYTQNLLF
jgi:predicted nucleic acid-binding protein